MQAKMQALFVDGRVKFPTIEVANEADYQCCRLLLDHWRAISVLIADLTPISRLSDQEVNSGHRADWEGFLARHFLRRRRAAFRHFLSAQSIS